MRLLPRWNFFAPRPGRRDQHLVYRDTVDGVPGPWCEIDTGRSPVVTRWLVNPARFRQKAMIDLVNRLFTARRELIERVGDEQGLQLSSGYLAILTWAMAQPAAHRPCVRQFADRGDRRPCTVARPAAPLHLVAAPTRTGGLRSAQPTRSTSPSAW